MRQVFILFVFIIFVIISGFIFISKSGNTRLVQIEEDPDVVALYKQYCLGCHNDKKSSFVNRDWMFGESRDEIFKSTKFGRPAHGMPAFEAGLSDEKILQLSDYIINLAEMVPLVENTHHAEGGIENSEDLKFKVETILSGLDVPWGMAFMPDGGMLVTERKGDLLLHSKDGSITKIKDVPKVKAEGQGGLLDIELHPDYRNNGWIYMSFSYPDEKNASLATTAIMRGRLKGDRLVDQEILFKALPEAETRHHYGSKLEFDNDGYLYFSVGDRGNRDRNSQYLDNDCGKVHRIKDDGSVPEDNPFVKDKNAHPTIYSYGHRNIQGLCLNPVTGQIWTDEHGPKGGDEINLIEPGKNYGWPVISFGINYNGTIFTNDTAKAGMEQPLLYWVPSIAPCGMTFVKGNRYPQWKNNILTGSLRFEYLKRVVLDGTRVVHQENLLENVGRVRNVEMSPDGYIYVAIERPGKILRLVPLE